MVVQSLVASLCTIHAHIVYINLIHLNFINHLVLLTMRVYALHECSRKVLVGLLFAGAGVIIVGCVSVSIFIRRINHNMSL